MYDNVSNFHLQWFELARATCEAVGRDVPAVYPVVVEGKEEGIMFQLRNQKNILSD